MTLRTTALLLLLLLLLAPALATAQSWQYSEGDNGHRVFASAQAGVGLDFICNAPSPQGLDAMTADAHENTNTPQGQILIEISQDRVEVGNDNQRGDVVLWLDQTGYRLPVTQFSELNGVWEVQLGTSDPLFAALASVGQMIIAAGDERAWQLPTDGLAEAVGRSIDTCARAWNLASPVPAAPAPAPAPALGRAQAHVTTTCGGPYTETAPAFLSGAVDGDDAPDVLVWWDNITCQTGQPRPVCGASHCSADLFLSSRVEPDNFLAQAASLIPLSNGRMGLSLSGRFDSCGAGSLGCDTIWYWNGAAMVQLQ